MSFVKNMNISEVSIQKIQKNFQKLGTELGEFIYNFAIQSFSTKEETKFEKITNKFNEFIDKFPDNLANNKFAKSLKKGFSNLTDEIMKGLGMKQESGFKKFSDKFIDTIKDLYDKFKNSIDGLINSTSKLIKNSTMYIR